MKKLFLSFILIFIGTTALNNPVEAATATTYETVIFMDKDGQYKSLTKAEYRAIKRLNKTFLEENSYSHLQVLGKYYSKAQYRHAIREAKKVNDNKFNYLSENYEIEDIKPLAWEMDPETGKITGTVEPEVEELRVISIQ